MRLLSPGDYGLVAIAMVCMNVPIMFAEAGLGAALVQAQVVDEHKQRRILGARILFNRALFARQFAAAPLIAGFFWEERLVAIIRVLSLQTLLIAFGLVPNAMLSRPLDFKDQALIGLASAACSSVCTLILALAAYGVWALVFGSLVASRCQTVGANITAPLHHPPGNLKRADRHQR